MRAKYNFSMTIILLNLSFIYKNIKTKKQGLYSNL